MDLDDEVLPNGTCIFPYAVLITTCRNIIYALFAGTCRSAYHFGALNILS